MTITEAFIRYDQELTKNGMKIKTRKNYRGALNSFTQHCGDIPIELLTFDVVSRWQLGMGSYGYQQSYIKSNLCKLREVLRFFRLRGVNVIDGRDIQLPKIPPKKHVWLDYSEIQSILGVITSPRDKAIVGALFASGARISELLQLNRDSIVNGKAQIIGKGDKPGTLFFDSFSMKLINQYLETRKDELRPLFISGHYRRITASRVEQLLHIYSDRAGIDKNVTPHVLRHSFASDLKNNGADIYDIKQQLRHSQISTTQIYVHTEEESKLRVYNKFHTNLAGLGELSTLLDSDIS